MQPQRIVAFIMVLALLVAGCSSTSAPAPTNAVVFKTPEEAITYYFEGLAQNDVQKILQACAVDEMSEKFNFAGYVDRLGGAFQPSSSQAPANYPLYVEVNKLQLSARILTGVKVFAHSLLSSEKVMTAARSAKWMLRASTTS